MVLKIIWRKMRLYKRFELDIWGFHLLNPSKQSKLSQMFYALYLEKMEIVRKKKMRHIYRIDLDQPSRVKKRQKWKFLSRRISRLFYLTLSYGQFRKLAFTASKIEGSRESGFIMLIENRVAGILYRMHFLSNIFELRHFILTGNVLLENKLVTYYNAPVSYGEIIRLRTFTSKNIKLNIIKRFVRGGFYFNVPRYLYVSYKLMFGFVWKEPKVKDLTFPVKVIDIYRSADVH